MKVYSTYLFDVDGTLIDTAELIYRCFKFSTKKYANLEVSRDLIMKHIGLPFRKQLETYIGEVSETRANEIFEGHMEFQREVYPKYLRLFPEIHELLENLQKNNKKLGIVTSRKKDTLNLYLQETGIKDFFDVMITPEDTKVHKPSPEPIYEALRQLESTPEDSIYIGDSVFDIEAGSRASCDTAFVEWSQVHHSECHIPPTYVLKSPHELIR